MFEWYPDRISYYHQYESTQDDTGHYVEQTGSWVELGNCRIERTAQGSSISDNANVRAHSFTIYTPKDATLPKIGVQIKVVVKRDGKEMETIEAQVKDRERGYRHNRIWAT